MTVQVMASRQSPLCDCALFLSCAKTRAAATSEGRPGLSGFHLEGGHVDDEAVLHIALEHPFIGIVDILDGNHFHIRHYVVLAAEIEHLLSRSHTANHGGRYRLAADHHGHAVQGRFERAKITHQHQGPLETQGGNVGIEIVHIGHGIDDEVEVTRNLSHLGGIGRDDDPVGAEPMGILFLAGRAGKQRHFGTHRLGQLDGHMAETAESHDGDPAAGADVGVFQG